MRRESGRPFRSLSEEFIPKFDPFGHAPQPSANAGGEPSESAERIARLEKEVVYTRDLTATCKRWYVGVKELLSENLLEEFLVELKNRNATAIQFFRVYLDSGREDFVGVFHRLEFQKDIGGEKGAA